ncbi:fluoride efflux transporter CrcB [Oscillochloris sp. ZM17-4]|uniref:fluoride efflux transporter CrcB n=1 Tax=Oscillochloris sp. ZM17-4 TaxID=2866714 RepID=UPI001C72CDF4|nr:fluoride efflux transporter CrcB [Oscillochloris sp. ZM17-4]MBX0329486.1 fluoride efflux transporter CrcB [Oscillochloris sp. ZM17-4]
MLNMIAVAVGAAVGANLRYLLSGWVSQRLGGAFPYGTLVVNIVGCLVIGALLTLAATRVSLSEPLRLLLVTGLLGGFTTFSSFGYEAYALIGGGDWQSAAVYMAGSLGLGLAAVFLGAGAVRLLLGG